MTKWGLAASDEAMRYSDFYDASRHPRGVHETRSVGGLDVRLTRMRQQAHALEDPATDELIVGVVLGGDTRCRWTWGDGWNVTDHRRAGDIGLSPIRAGGAFEIDGDHELLVLGVPVAALVARGALSAADAPQHFGRLHDAYHRDRTAFELCRELWRLAAKRSPEGDMRADEIIGLLLERWSRLSRGPAPEGRSYRPLDLRVLVRIADEIAGDPGGGHPLERWARLASMTVPAFCRAFKARTGVSPHRFLLVSRIAIAERLLGAPRSDIDEIADGLGFDSRAHFTRVFARLTGRAPRDRSRSTSGEDGTRSG